MLRARIGIKAMPFCFLFSLLNSGAFELPSHFSLCGAKQVGSGSTKQLTATQAVERVRALSGGFGGTSEMQPFLRSIYLIFIRFFSGSSRNSSTSSEDGWEFVKYILWFCSKLVSRFWHKMEKNRKED